MSLFALNSLPGYTPLGQHPDVAPPRPGRAAHPSVGKGKAAAQPPPPPPQAPGDVAAAAAAWVKTDDDVVAFFEQHGDRGMQFFYCLRQQGGNDGDGGATSSGSGGGTAVSWDAATGEFFLQVVPQERVQHAKHYFIISQRTVVRVSRGEHTEAVPLAEWRSHKQAFLSMRRLTFFGSHAVAKMFSLWRANARALLHRRRAAQLEQRLLLASLTFQEPLLKAVELLERLRGVRAAGVQPERRYSAADWAECQGAWRSRSAQPELEGAAAALAQLAEGVCGNVEAQAQAMLASVRPAELSDRIGVDLHAATSKAKARSMQDIKADKLARSAAYRRALAERNQLPRLLRLLDLRLAGVLAEGAAATVGEASAVLRAAAPGLLQRWGAVQADGSGGGREEQRAGSAASCSSQGQGAEGEEEEEESGNDADGSAPVFLCHVMLGEDGSIAFTPSEAEWVAALDSEVAASCLHLAASQPALLTLPAFERYRAQLAAAAVAEEEQAVGEQAATVVEEGQAAVEMAADAKGPGQGPEQATGIPHRASARQLAQADPAFTGGTAEMQALLAASFTQARQLARRFERYVPIHRFGASFDCEAWAAEQRAGLDLGRTEALMRRLQGWQEQLERMPLSCTAGLLHLDASGLQARLAPAAASALERISSLLLGLVAERCRALLGEASQWREVAAARPLELEGFLAWSAELARLQKGVRVQVEAAGAADAALELVVAFAGRLPTADAVKKDDLREAAVQLPLELEASAAWAAEQRVLHAAAVAEQARGVAEEAVLLESELQVGAFVDAGAPSSEVLAVLDLQRARLAQLVAQAEELARLQHELAVEAAGPGAGPGAPPSAGAVGGIPWEVQDAEATLQRCFELWALVAEAEALRDGGPAEQLGEQAEGGADGPLAALRARLAGLRGNGGAPPCAVWLRANTAVLACVGGLPA